MVDRVVFTNETDLWRTEPALVRYLSLLYRGFDLDAAASDARIAPAWLGPGGACEDALHPSAVWFGRVFLNPPYSEVGRFIERACYEAQENPQVSSITCLVGARTETRWWQQAWPVWSEVLLLQTRCRFWLTPAELDAINEARAWREQPPITDSNTAPFPSAVLHFERGATGGPVVRCVDWRTEVVAMESALREAQVIA